MRYWVAAFIIILCSQVATGQTIKLGVVSDSPVCIPGKITVPYEAQGTYNAGNAFLLQFSDTSGVFPQFQSSATSTTQTGAFQVSAPGPGKYRVRVIATNPGVTSDTSSEIRAFPTPGQPAIAVRNTVDGRTYVTWPRSYFDGTAGFVGDSLIFYSPGQQSSPGYIWTFDPDASVTVSHDSAVGVRFAHEGWKTARLVVKNQAECTNSYFFRFYEMSCSPTIPRGVRTIPPGASALSTDSIVWVQNGATYKTGNRDYFNEVTVFAEPYATVTIGNHTVCYQRGENFVHTNSGGGMIDSFKCNDLAFDYSNLSVTPPQGEALSVTLYPNPASQSVTIRNASHVTITSMLGISVADATNHDRSDLTLDISKLPAGMYFVRSDGSATMQKLLKE